MLEMSIKQWFFDRERVLKAVNRGKIKALSKAGAFVRTRARSSIRKRKRVSFPGQPPSSHTGLLRNWILFGYEPRTESVVVGPAKLNKRGQVPSILEFGGSVMGPDGRDHMILPRPYMGPALEAEQDHIPEAFAATMGP